MVDVSVMSYAPSFSTYLQDSLDLFSCKRISQCSLHGVFLLSERRHDSSNCNAIVEAIIVGISTQNLD